MNKSKEYLFFKDRDYFPVSYKNMFLLFEKHNESYPNQLSIFCNNLKYLVQYDIKKVGQNYIFPIFKSQLSEGFLEIESKINQFKSKLIKNIDYKLNYEQDEESIKKQINL